MHASSTLPAFVLSQNQTLHKEIDGRGTRSLDGSGGLRPVAGGSLRAGLPAGTRLFRGPVSCLLRHVRHSAGCRGPGPLRFGTGGAARDAGWRHIAYRAMAFGFQRAQGSVRRHAAVPALPLRRPSPLAGRAACRAATGRHDTPPAGGMQGGNFKKFHFPCNSLYTSNLRDAQNPPAPLPGAGNALPRASA